MVDMDNTQRGDLSAQDRFRIEDGAGPSKPLWQQRWFQIASVLLVLAVGGALLVQSQGDKFLASWYSSRAETKASRGDYQGAVADMNHAIEKTPDNLELYTRRGDYRLLEEEPDLEAALADFNHVLEADPHYSTGYSRRSFVYQRQAFMADDPAEAKKLHALAIEDLRQALPDVPQNDPEFLNQLAYARALAGIDLEQALEDINRALRGVDAERLLARVKASSSDPMELQAAWRAAGMLDTRGYIEQQLGKNEAALIDMDHALNLLDAAAKPFAARFQDAQVRDAFLKREEQTRAVLLHHRGLIHQALGNKDQAKADLDLADELGFNPRAGVF